MYTYNFILYIYVYYMSCEMLTNIIKAIHIIVKLDFNLTLKPLTPLLINILVYRLYNS